VKQKPPFENIEPQPNPKHLTVERVNIALTNEDGKEFASGPGFVRNANIHPAKLIRRW
jgi:hypothetical protein